MAKNKRPLKKANHGKRPACGSKRRKKLKKVKT